MKIKKGGITRDVSEKAFKNKWKSLGYEKIKEEKEPLKKLRGLSGVEKISIRKQRNFKKS